MFTNPKELETYWRSGYWIEYVPYNEEKEIDDQGNVTITKNLPTFIDKPIYFRYKFKDNIGVERTELVMIEGRLSVNAGAKLETRSKIPFKQEDLILDDWKVKAWTLRENEWIKSEVHSEFYYDKFPTNKETISIKNKINEAYEYQLGIYV